jgi:hypothetical protein
LPEKQNRREFLDKLDLAGFDVSPHEHEDAKAAELDSSGGLYGRGG